MGINITRRDLNNLLCQKWRTDQQIYHKVFYIEYMVELCYYRNLFHVGMGGCNRQ